jgi:hypothetical protein
LPAEPFTGASAAQSEALTWPEAENKRAISKKQQIFMI